LGTFRRYRVAFGSKPLEDRSLTDAARSSATVDGPTPTAWPDLPWQAWTETMTTVQLWTQIVGKIRLTASPPLNHLWEGCLSVTPRGLTTGTMPHGQRLFQIDLDFIGHRLLVADSDGRSVGFALEQMSVAAFYRRLFALLSEMEIEIGIHGRPNEMAIAIPFAEDEQHATYDPEHAQLLWRAFATAHRLLTEYRAPFVGKASPVNFFWGTFDLAVARYSGRPAPLHPGGAPNCPPWVEQEAYSREQVAAGFWPGSATTAPMFYSYTYPAPSGYEIAPIEPAGAWFDRQLGEFVLPYEVARTSGSADEGVMAFLETAFAAGTRHGEWDLSLLEPEDYPTRRPPGRAWTVIDRVG
jgi:hypothetical protein